MSKALLVSVVLALVAIPAFVSREANPVKALKKAIAYTLAFNILYAAALRFIYPRL